MSGLLSQFTPPSPPGSVTVSPFSMPESLFLPCKWVHRYHFSRFRVHVLINNICFSFSDLTVLTNPQGNCFRFHLCCVKNKCFPLFFDGKVAKAWTTVFKGAGWGRKHPTHRLNTRFRKGQGLWNGASLTEEPTSPSRKEDISANSCLSQAHEPRSLHPHSGAYSFIFPVPDYSVPVSDGFFWPFCSDLLTWHQWKGKTKQTSIYCGKKSWVFTNVESPGPLPVLESSTGFRGRQAPKPSMLMWVFTTL